MVIPDWKCVCVCVSTDCWNGNGSVAVVRQMQYDTIHVWPFVSSASHTQWAIYYGRHSVNLWFHLSSFFFSPFNGYTHYYYTYLRWIQLQCATITRDHLKASCAYYTKKKERQKIASVAGGIGQWYRSYPSIPSLLAKGKMVSANDEMTNTSRMHTTEARERAKDADRTKRNETCPCATQHF